MYTQGRIKPPKAARGHATYANVKIQTWPPVPKISYAVYGYTMFAHAQFTRASGCKSHSYAIKQIHGRSQPPFPYTAVANIRKTPPCLNLDIDMAIYGSYMPSRCLRRLDTPLVHPTSLKNERIPLESRSVSARVPGACSLFEFTYCTQVVWL